MNVITRETLPLLSFIIGLGFAVLMFHRPFHIKKTLALPMKDIHGKTVRVDGKCYKYVAEDSHCEILTSK